MKKDWQVSIQRQVGRIDLALYIYRDLGNGKFEQVIGNDTIVTLNEGAAFEPTLTLYADMLPVLMKELSQFGVKIPEQSFIEGKLYATEEHLKDMRKLVFEPVVTNVHVKE